MGWAGHVARMGEKKNTYRVLVEEGHKQRNHLDDLNIDGRIIFKWILKT
jgi:hypothetical protein